MTSNSDIKINWNRPLLTEPELDVIEKQADLFEECQTLFNVDAHDFIEKFMLSDIAKALDKADTTIYSEDLKKMGEILLKQVVVKPLEKEVYPEALYWIGYLYRYWALMGTPSSEIIKVAPVAKAQERYIGYHTMGTQEAIGRLIHEYSTGN